MKAFAGATAAGLLVGGIAAFGMARGALAATLSDWGIAAGAAAAELLVGGIATGGMSRDALGAALSD